MTNDLPLGLTFDAFQASKRLSFDLGSDLNTDEFGAAGSVSGFIYLGDAYIMSWPDDGGRYELVISNLNWTGTDLARLERILWVEHHLPENQPPGVPLQDLDNYVLASCESRGWQCDGGIFSVMFSGKDEWLIEDASAMIVRAGEIYPEIKVAVEYHSRFDRMMK